MLTVNKPKGLCDSLSMHAWLRYAATAASCDWFKQGPKIFHPMNKLLKKSGPENSTASTPGTTHRFHRILVVDDDTSIRKIGAEVLARHGYRVDAAADGPAGWKALQTYTYDLLITDLDMPKLSGLKLVKKLRAARLALPVILASGIMTPQELSRSSWLHLSGALLKPVFPEQLLQTVQAVLRAPDGAREQIAPPNWQSQLSAGGLRLR